MKGLFGFRIPKRVKCLLNSDIGSGTDKNKPGGSSFSFMISYWGGLNSAYSFELSGSDR